MSLSHMLSLVHVGSLSSIEGPIVLVYLVLWCGISTVETGLICSEVRIFTNACLNTEASWDGAMRLGCISASLNCCSLFHGGGIHRIDVVEGLVCFSKLASVWLSN